MNAHKQGYQRVYFDPMPRATDEQLRQFGAALGKRMDEVGMTNAEMANRLKYDPQTVRNYRAGLREPRPSVMARIEALLEVEPGTFAGMLIGPLVARSADIDIVPKVDLSLVERLTALEERFDRLERSLRRLGQ